MKKFRASRLAGAVHIIPSGAKRDFLFYFARNNSFIYFYQKQFTPLVSVWRTDRRRSYCMGRVRFDLIVRSVGH